MPAESENFYSYSFGQDGGETTEHLGRLMEPLDYDDEGVLSLAKDILDKGNAVENRANPEEALTQLSTSFMRTLVCLDEMTSRASDESDFDIEIEKIQQLLVITVDKYVRQIADGANSSQAIDSLAKLCEAQGCTRNQIIRSAMPDFDYEAKSYDELRYEIEGIIFEAHARGDVSMAAPYIVEMMTYEMSVDFKSVMSNSGIDSDE